MNTEFNDSSLQITEINHASLNVLKPGKTPLKNDCDNRLRYDCSIVSVSAPLSAPHDWSSVKPKTI